MPDQGERIAALEVHVAELGKDLAAMSAQIERSRSRLHNLEGFAQGVLDIQRENRRQEARQYRRMANAIQFGGLVMAAALVALGVITIVIHAG